MTSLRPLLEYWPAIAIAVLNGLTFWACWSLRQLAKTEVGKAVEKLSAVDGALDGRIDQHDTRLTQVEGRMDDAEKDIGDLPTKADLARVEGEVKVANANIKTVNEGVRRIEGYFLERGVDRS